MECVKEAVCSCNDCLLEAIELFGSINVMITIVLFGLVIYFLYKLSSIYDNLVEVWK